MPRPELIERELCMNDAAQDLQVLVVDDSPVYRKLVEHALEGGAYSLLFAKSGREALELFVEKYPPDELGHEVGIFEQVRRYHEEQLVAQRVIVLRQVEVS